MVALSGTAQAALVSLGNGTVRDTNTNLIWLQTWSSSGLANWGRQKHWAENLSFAGSDEWRLPEISEYGALFTAYGDLTKVAEFSNVDTVGYWSGTEYAPDPNEAWYFFAASGSPFFDPKSPQLFAVAVRPGGVVASVPEPQTLALALLALGAMVVARRRRTA